MSLANFIPLLWSETLLKQLDREYIAVKNSNRAFEGEIKQMGNEVFVGSIGGITVADYNKNTDMADPQTLTSSLRSISINQAKYFNFLIDDIDKAQAAPDIMREAMRSAANALSDAADRYVYSLHAEVPTSNIISNAAFSHNNALDIILAAKERLMANNVNSNVDTVLEVSPAIGAQILKAKILDGTSNKEEMDNGFIGSFVGFKVYISNNIARDAQNNFKCLARTTRAISFAEQLREVEAFRPEKRFADAVRGLHLYGARVIYPSEIVVLNVRTA